MQAAAAWASLKVEKGLSQGRRLRDLPEQDGGFSMASRLVWPRRRCSTHLPEGARPFPQGGPRSRRPSLPRGDSIASGCGSRFNPRRPWTRPRHILK